MNEKHQEITDKDVLTAWKNCFRSLPRIAKNPCEYIAVGMDGKGRLIELASTRLLDGSWIIFHALTPPTQKTSRELGFNERRDQ